MVDEINGPIGKWNASNISCPHGRPQCQASRAIIRLCENWLCEKKPSLSSWEAKRKPLNLFIVSLQNGIMALGYWISWETSALRCQPGEYWISPMTTTTTLDSGFQFSPSLINFKIHLHHRIHLFGMVPCGGIVNSGSPKRHPYHIEANATNSRFYCFD